MFLQDSGEAIQNCWIGMVRNSIVYFKRVVVHQSCISCTLRTSYSSFTCGLEEMNAILGTWSSHKSNKEKQQGRPIIDEKVACSTDGFRH